MEHKEAGVNNGTQPTKTPHPRFGTLPDTWYAGTSSPPQAEECLTKHRVQKRNTLYLAARAQVGTLSGLHFNIYVILNEVKNLNLRMLN